MWTAPACFYGTALVSATLTDATGASTTQAFTVTAGVANCPPRPIQIASVSTAGVQSNGDSAAPSISADGRYVAFMSYGTALGAGAPYSQIFVRDVIAGTTTLVSARSDGTMANSYSYAPSISGDGRYVAFASSASNLGVANATQNTNVFVRDLQLGTLVNVTAVTGAQYTDSPRLSSDGRHLCFETNVAYDANDTNGDLDVYWTDLAAGTLVRVSSGQPTGHSGWCSLSADGGRVSFASNAAFDPADINNSWDVYARDMHSGQISLMTDGVHTLLDLASAVSSTGQYVAFSSAAPLLGEGNAVAGSGIYVRDVGTGALRGVSDRTAQTYAYAPAFSSDATVIAFEGQSAGLFLVYTRDLTTGTMTLQSTSAAGTRANNSSSYLALSGDGRYVAFDSYATNLVGGDTNGKSDIFVAPRR